MSLLQEVGRVSAILISGVTATILVLAISVAVILGIALYLRRSYTSLLRLKNDLEKSFSSIDVLLKQRHDELPKLIQTCRPYMQREQKPLQDVTEARAAYARAGTPVEKAQADHMLTRALDGLFILAQKYPDLKTNANFVQLQKRIGRLEESIAAQGTAHNENVTAFNTRLARVPEFLVARFMRLDPRPLFQAPETDREGPPVKPA